MDYSFPTRLCDEVIMSNTKSFIIWIALVLLTLSSFFIAQLNLINQFGQETIMLVLLGTILIKGIMVTEHFMALSKVKTFWRIIPIIYLLLVCLLIWKLF
jgi:uncharacterized membrane protein